MLVALAWASPASAAPPDTIRVPGLSAPGNPRVAIVVSDERLAGERFQVLTGSGNVVGRGKLKRVGGSASPWRHAAKANVSTPSAPGSYRLRVGGLQSPKWTIADGAASSLIDRVTSIFFANADGGEFNPVFGPAHLNDAAAPIVGGPTNGGTINVSGGWRDAGDAIKFTVTIATSSLILDYAAALDPANAATLTALSDIGIRWLEKAHPGGSQTFIAQVGGESDHEGGFRDFAQDDSNPNPAFSRRNAYGDIGSGPAGAASAALALAAIREGLGTARGAQLLTLARQWYDRGKAVAGSGPALEGFPQPGGDGFSDWQGFMAMASALLFRAGAGNANGDPFLTDALGFLGAATPENGFSPYFSISGLAAAELAGGMVAPPVQRADVLDLAQSKLRDAVDGAAFRAGLTAFGTPGGFYFGWVSDHAGGGALLAAAQRAGIFGRGLAMANLARDYLLGLNPWGASFLVGSQKRDAHNPHHSIFLKGTPSDIGNGFVVGGPAIESQFADFGLKPAKRSPYVRFNPTYQDDQYNDTVVYEDRRADFITSEVGLAYSASAMLLFALTH